METILQNNSHELIGCASALIGYILRQIDLKRIKQGKKPLFNFFDVIKH